MNTASEIREPSLSIVGTWIAQVFDKSPLGVLQLDHEWKVLYANKTTNDILGLDSLSDKGLEALLQDENARELIRNQMALRSEGFSDEYEVEIVQFNTQKRIPISIAAMPVMASDGTFAGSIAILRSLEVERATKKFKQLIEDALGSEEVLKIAAEQTRLVIPFDAFAASSYSQDMSHALVLFQYPDFVPGGHRWYPITGTTLKLVQDDKPSRRKLSELYEEMGSPELKLVIEKGFQWMLRYPVESEGHVVGSISLLTKKSQGFSDDEFKMFKSLPLAKAFLASLFFMSRQELQFRFNLVKEISRCKTDLELFKLVVDRLHEQYSWSHVSVFTVDNIDHCFVLQSQSGELELRKDYSQSIDLGLLGHVFRSRHDVNVADVRTDPKFKDIVYYTDERRRLVSELCMAVYSGDELYALLNIEDWHSNAFSKDEEKVLRSLLDDIGAIIDRRRRDNLAVALVKSTPTAVFLVDGNGIIRDANPAAESLVGYERLKSDPAADSLQRNKQSALYGHSIAQYVSDPKAGEALAKSPSPGGELEVVTKAKKTLRVHVGGSVLESAFNRRMIIFRDMSLEIRMKEIKSAALVLANLARRVNTPLSIVGLGLQELRSQLSALGMGLVSALFSQRPKTAEMGDTIDKIVSQLHRIELAYNELQLYGIEAPDESYRQVRIGLQQFVDDVIQELPKSDVKRLKLTPLDDLPDIHGDAFQLAFVIQTLAVHLLQMGAPGKEVEIRIKAFDGDLEFVFEGAYPASFDQYRSKDDLTKAKANIGLLLAEDTINRFVANHKGRYDNHVIDAGKIRFRFVIPVKGTLTDHSHE